MSIRRLRGVTTEGEDSMKIAATTATQSTGTTASATDQISSETFLTLLTTQLKNQDPLEPMSGSDMLTQISQLTTVEQMMKLNETLSTFGDGGDGIAQLSSLLGREVEWLDEDTGARMSGKVTRAQMGSDGWEVSVGGRIVGVGDLLAVE